MTALVDTEWTEEVCRFSRSQRMIRLDCGLVVRARVSGAHWTSADPNGKRIYLESSAVNGCIDIAHIAEIDGLVRP